MSSSVKIIQCSRKKKLISSIQDKDSPKASELSYMSNFKKRDLRQSRSLFGRNRQGGESNQSLKTYSNCVTLSNMEAADGAEEVGHLQRGVTLNLRAVDKLYLRQPHPSPKHNNF